MRSTIGRTTTRRCVDGCVCEGEGGVFDTRKGGGGKFGGSWGWGWLERVAMVGTAVQLYAVKGILGCTRRARDMRLCRMLACCISSRWLCILSLAHVSYAVTVFPGRRGDV